jgi:hypothetical protein
MKLNSYRANAFFGLQRKLSIDKMIKYYYIKYQWLVGWFYCRKNKPVKTVRQTVGVISEYR